MTSRAVKIAPSLLSADFGRLREEIQAVEEAGADLLHLDVMDGHFVPNITIGPVVLSRLRGCTRLPFDVHLMIEEPDRYVPAFVDAGADMISVHLEAAVHLQRTLAAIRERGIKAGVAINPATSPDGVRYIADDLDFVLVMSVNPGFGGQAFIPSSMRKLRDLRTLLEELGSSALIEIDGGVGPANAAEVADAGARILVAGAAIFGHPPYGEVIRKMRSREAGARRQKGKSSAGPGKGTGLER